MKNYMQIIILSISLLFLLNYSYVHADDGSINGNFLENDTIENNTTEDSNIETNAADEDIIEEEYPQIQVHKYFYDVPTDHFAYEAINNLYEIGATNFRQEHKFMPNEWISRGEFLHMLLQAKGFSPIDLIVPVFNDVNDDVPYANYIDTAYRLGIVDGVGNGQFRPGDPVKRDELIKMVITGKGILKYDPRIHYSISWSERSSLLSAFLDKYQISYWSEHYITHAIKYNLINGYPDNTIRPKQYTTRAEAAVMIDRFFLSDTNENNVLSSLTINDINLLYTERLVLEATQYNSSQPGLSNYTRSGLTTRIGAVAVDPAVIPLGTHLYIEGYGYAIAADTGGAIKGNKIDLYAASIQAAMQFGRQNVVVYVLP